MDVIGNSQYDFTAAFEKYEKQDTFIKKLFQDIHTVQDKDWVQTIKQIDKSSIRPISQKDIVEMLALIDNPESRFEIAGQKLNLLKEIKFQSEFFVILVILLGLVAKKVDKDVLQKEDQLLKQPDLQAQETSHYQDQMLQDSFHELGRTWNQSIVETNSAIEQQVLSGYAQPFGIGQEISDISHKSQILSKDSFITTTTTHFNDEYQRILKTLQGQPSYVLLGMYQEIKRIYPHDCHNRILLGKLYYKLKHYRLALREFDEVYKFAPQRFVIDYYRGLCLKSLNKMQGALNMMASVIWDANVNPSHSIVFQALFEAGLISITLFKYFEAILYFKRCLDIKPKSYRAYYQYLYSLYLAQSYQQACQFAKTNQWIQVELIRQRPIVAAIINNLIASILSEVTSSIEKSSKYFDSALKLYNQEHIMRKPGKDRNEYSLYDDDNKLLKFVFMSRGQAFLKHNRLQEAITDFKEAKLKVQSANILPTTFLVVCYYKLIASKKQNQNIQPTVALLSEFILEVYDWFHHYQLLFPMQHLKQALEFILQDKIFEQMSDKINEELKDNGVEFQYKCEIVRYIKDMIEILSGAMIVQRIRQCDSGSFLLQKGQLQLAKKCFLFAQKSGPSVEGYIGLGKTYLQLLQLDKALIYFKSINAQQPFNIDALKGLKSIYQKKGNKKLHEEYLRKLLAQCPGDAQHLRQLSFLCFRDEKIDEGRYCFIASLKKLQITDSCFTLLQELYLKKSIKSNDEIFNEMNIWADKASQADKNKVLRFYIDLRIKSQAKKMILKGPPVNKQQRVYYCALFFKFMENHEFKKEELEEFRFIIDLLGQQIAKKDPNLIKQLADLYCILGAYEIAFHLYQKAIEQYDMPEALCGFNECYNIIKDIPSPKQTIYRQILYLEQLLYGSQESVDISDPTTSFYSAYPSSVDSSQPKVEDKNADIKRLCKLYKQTGYTSQNSLKALSKVVTFKPLNYQYLQMLISLQIKLNYVSQALESIEIFIKNDPSNPFIYSQIQNIATRDQKIKRLLQESTSHPSAKSILADRIISIITDLPNFQVSDRRAFIFCFCYLEMYDQSLEQFKQIVDLIKDNKLKNKRQEIIKLIGLLKKAQNRYPAKDILIIMRALIHRVNQNITQEHNAYKQLINRQQHTKELKGSYQQWFSQFILSISDMSVKNQVYLIFYVLKFLQDTKHPESTNCEETIINIYKQSNPDILINLEALSRIHLEILI